MKRIFFVAAILALSTGFPTLGESEAPHPASSPAHPSVAVPEVTPPFAIEVHPAPTLDQRVHGLETATTGNKADIGRLTLQGQSLQARTDALDAKVKALAKQYGTDIPTLKGSIGTLAAAHGALKTQVDTHTAALETLRRRQTELQTQLQALADRHKALEAQVGQNASDISAFGDRTGRTEATVKRLQAENRRLRKRLRHTAAMAQRAFRRPPVVIVAPPPSAYAYDGYPPPRHTGLLDPVIDTVHVLTLGIL